MRKGGYETGKKAAGWKKGGWLAGWPQEVGSNLLEQRPAPSRNLENPLKANKLSISPKFVFLKKMANFVEFQENNKKTTRVPL